METIARPEILEPCFEEGFHPQIPFWDCSRIQRYAGTIRQCLMQPLH
jgi:hypothetical protein